MILSVDRLKEMGSFVGPPVEREITWKQGGDELTATVYVRRVSYKSIAANLTSWESDDDAMARWLAACICDDKGDAILTPEDITGEADPERGPLDGNLTIALLGAATEVNQLSKNPKG